MKKIYLTQNKFALVDDKHFQYLNQWSWAYANGYAVRTALKDEIGPSTILMHRVIAELISLDLSHEVDHTNANSECDGLNNQSYNLRAATRTENNCNQRSRGITSKFKGVHWHKRKNRWQSRIQINGKQKHLGYFTNELEAASVYDQVAQDLHGVFARLNNS